MNPMETLADTHTKTFSELEGWKVGLLVVGTAVGKNVIEGWPVGSEEGDDVGEVGLPLGWPLGIRDG
jgi:hypothetical protein